MARIRKDNEGTKKLMVYFIAFIMIGSVFGVMFYGFTDDGNSVKFNGFTFTQKQDLWVTRIDNVEAPFHSLPESVLNLDIDDGVLERFNDIIEIDTTSEPNSTLKEYIALSEHHMNFVLNNLGSYVRSGFTKESEFDKDIITCNDSTEVVPVIYFTEGDETKVYLKDNCIIAQAKDGYDLLRIKDRIMYEILGVIDG